MDRIEPPQQHVDEGVHCEERSRPLRSRQRELEASARRVQLHADRIAAVLHDRALALPELPDLSEELLGERFLLIIDLTTPAQVVVEEVVQLDATRGGAHLPIRRAREA